MRKMILKVSLLSLFVLGVVGGINFIADPANLFGEALVREMTTHLLQGEIVQSPGDYDEGLLQKEMLTGQEPPETVIVGSSSILYVPWEYPSCYVAGVSGAFLRDYLAVIGILDASDRLPKRIVLGIDPWILKRDNGIGRHTSIAGYADYEIAQSEDYGPKPERAEGSQPHGSEASHRKPKRDGGRIAGESTKSRLDRVWELFSFAYFQSSIRFLQQNGLAECLKSPQERTRVMTEEEARQIPCLLPGGGHTALPHYDTAQNDGTALSAIDDKNLPGMGDEFRKVDERNRSLLEQELAYLKARGTEVEIYLPTLYPVLYEYVKGSEDYAGVTETEALLRELGKTYEIPVHGSFDPERSGTQSGDFADWLHVDGDAAIREYLELVE